MKTLVDLEDNECRYPTGDGPFLFCGDPKQDKSSYCPHHHEICWNNARTPVAKSRIYHGTNFAA